MTLRVFTARLGLRDRDVLDITRKSARGDGLAFAPSWSILRPALDELKTARDEIGFASCALDDFNGRWRERRAWWGYVAAYMREMRESYQRDRGPWERLLSCSRVILCCYCTDPDRCHRTILAASILPQFGAEYAGEVDAAALEMLGGGR